MSGTGGSFWEQFARGGPVLWLLAVVALVALALAVERAVALSGAGIDAAAFLARVRRALLVDGSVRDAVKACEERRGPVPAAVKAGLLKLGQPREEVLWAAKAAANAEAARLERGLWALAAAARAAPLLGLLGAALALRPAAGTGWSGDVAAALFAAAFGLGVAIPVEIAYNYLLGRVRKATRDLEAARGSLRETLAEMERGGGAPGAGAPR